MESFYGEIEVDCQILIQTECKKCGKVDLIKTSEVIPGIISIGYLKYNM